MSDRLDIRAPLAFEVHFTRHVFRADNETLARCLEGDPARVVFFLDGGLVAARPGLPGSVADWCADRRGRIELAAPVQVVPGGERIKNDLTILDRLGSLARKARICRHSHVVIVGGGAVLDAVGFAAAIVHRGVRQVRVPTTVLSQGDSGVGVKNGVNRFGLKNFYGTFAPPWAVVNDLEMLATLEDRDWIAGVAEAFKVAILEDRQFLELLAESADRLADRDLDAMETIVRRSASLHLRHIAEGGDPFESGSSRPLDFGHWAAHRLESMTDHALRHGEAVSIGVALDLHVAVELGLLEPEEWHGVLGAMEHCGLPLFAPALLERDRNGRLAVLAGLEEFREHLGGRLTLAMPDGLGRKTEVHSLPEELVERAVAALARRTEPFSGKASISRIA